MFDIIIQGIIIALGTTLIVIRTKEPSQNLRTYIFLVIGVLLTLFGYDFEKSNAKKESRLIAKQINSISTQLSSMENLCDKKALNQMRVDVDSWATNLSASLEIREIEELKEKTIKAEGKLKKECL